MISSQLFVMSLCVLCYTIRFRDFEWSQNLIEDDVFGLSSIFGVSRLTTQNTVRADLVPHCVQNTELMFTFGYFTLVISFN